MIRKWLRKAFPNKINIGCFIAAMVVLVSFCVVLNGLARSLRAYTRFAFCAGHMKNLSAAFAQYTQDNDEVLPTRQMQSGAHGALISWRVPINRYVKDPMVFQCADNPAIGINNDIEHDGFSRSYAVNSASDAGRRFGPFADRFSHGLRMSKISAPEQVVMVTETTAAYNDINVLRPEAFTRPTNTETNNGNLFSGHGRLSMILYCDGHVHPLPITMMLDGQHWGIWTIDGKAFSPAEQMKARKVLEYSAKVYRE